MHLTNRDSNFNENLMPYLQNNSNIISQRPLSIISQTTGAQIQTGPITSTNPITAQAASSTRPNTTATITQIDDSQSADQFRQNLLQSLREKYNVSEFDTLSFHMLEEEYYLEYILNWGLSARIVDILKRPIIVIEE
jgi:hypothetical protein